MRRIGQAIGSSAAVALLGVIGYMPGLKHRLRESRWESRRW